MGDEKERPALAAHQAGHVVFEHELRLEIECGKRLVEQQNLRFVRERARQRDTRRMPPERADG